MLHIAQHQVGPHGGIPQFDGEHRHAQALGGQARITAPVVDAVTVDHHRAEVRTGKAVVHGTEQLVNVRLAFLLRELQPIAHVAAVGEGAHLVAVAQLVGEVLQCLRVSGAEGDGIARGQQRGGAVVWQHHHRLAHFPQEDAHHRFQQEEGQQREHQGTQRTHGPLQRGAPAVAFPRAAIEQPSAERAKQHAQRRQPKGISGGECHGVRRSR